jgi:hypothetical protein
MNPNPKLRESTNARCAMVIVLDGDKGGGFSVQADAESLLLVNIPQILRSTADQIEKGINVPDRN